MKTSGTWNVYRKEVPELPSVLELFQMEQEKGRKDRRLKNFPKSLTHWRPEAGKMEPQCEKALTAISWRPTAHSHTLKSVPKWKKAALTWLLVHFQATSHEKTQHCVFSIFFDGERQTCSDKVWSYWTNLSALFYIKEIHVGFCVIIWRGEVWFAVWFMVGTGANAAENNHSSF